MIVDQLNYDVCLCVCVCARAHIGSPVLLNDRDMF